MSDLDLVPPPMPGEQQKRSGGFLRRFFFKEEAAQPAPAPASAQRAQPENEHEEIDLEEIKRKLGLDEIAASSAQQQAFDAAADDLFRPPRSDEPEIEPALPSAEEAMPARRAQPVPVPAAPMPPAPLPPIVPAAPADSLQASPSARKGAVREGARKTAPAPKREAAQKATQSVRIDDWSADDAGTGPADAAPARSANAASGLDWTSDALPAQPRAQQDDAKAPAAGSWAQDAHMDLEDIPSERREGGEHHEAVDAHLAPVDKGKEAVAQAAAQAVPEPLPELSDWHMQSSEVPEDKYFILRNGHRVRSLRELLEAMEFIDDETFSHHVNEYRNDFANWVHGVIGKPKLAEQIRRADAKEDIVALLRKERKAAQDALATHVRKHEQGVKKLEGLSSQLDALKRQLDERTRQLESEKAKAAQRLKGALDKELEQRMKPQREALAKEREKVAEQQAQVQLLLSQAQDRMDAAQQREQAIGKREADVAARAAALAKEKQEAAPMLKDAQKVRADLERIEKYQKQVQEHLKSISKREADLARQEETLRQRERKLTQDLTRVKEEQERLAKLMEEHGAREAKVAKLEEQAKAAVQDAAKRKAEAAAQERKSADVIKAQTRQLESLRGQIEGALRRSIKNKDKAMHAKQLREHLEQVVRETREGVVAERKQLEAEGFSSYMQAKADSTPIGQPASRADEDVLRVRDLDIYRKVEQARAALERKDLATAKRLYGELREEFGKQKLEAAEKNALYMSIRELYDDIHLAMLEQ